MLESLFGVHVFSLFKAWLITAQVVVLRMENLEPSL
jgi:hypothetical protein